jgi:Gamma tubulin complex component C-terminal
MATQKAEDLIKKIKLALEKATNDLKTQKDYYEDIINKCNSPKGINQFEYNKIWRILNEFGSKDLFKIKDFSGEFLINPTLCLLKNTINELGANNLTESLDLYCSKAAEDYSFKEILMVISKLSCKKVKLACKNSFRVIQKLRIKKNVISATKGTEKSEFLEENLEGISVLFEPFFDCTIRSCVGSIIPNFISKQIFQKILETGKSLNSIKRFLPERLDSLDISTDLFIAVNPIENFCDLTSIELVRMFMDKYQFKPYCDLVKKFFLHGQGDFYYLLFEELFFNHRHDLDDAFQDCLEKSNAINDSIKYLDIIKLTADEDFYDIEWESYKLEVEIAYPVSLILTPNIIASLKKIFSVIWQVKRVDFQLKQSSFKRSLASGFYSIEITGIIQKLNLFHYKLIYFVNTMLYYFMEETVETYWKRFSTRLLSCKSFEDLEHNIQDLAFVLEKNFFLDSPRLSQSLFKLLSFIIKFIDLEHEIESSIIQAEDTNDNDYSEDFEILQSLIKDFLHELQEMKSNLKASQYRIHYYLILKLNEIKYY